MEFVINLKYSKQVGLARVVVVDFSNSVGSNNVKREFYIYSVGIPSGYKYKSAFPTRISQESNLLFYKHVLKFFTFSVLPNM